MVNPTKCAGEEGLGHKEDVITCSIKIKSSVLVHVNPGSFSVHKFVYPSAGHNIFCYNSFDSYTIVATVSPTCDKSNNTLCI